MVVICLIDSDGSVVVNYQYDSWGKVLSITGNLASTIGHKNPIRYRSYYYDSETNLYYLQSRYYDPETGRFISPDVIAEGGNIYAYCVNDPINRSDETGYLSTKWKKILKWAAVAVTAVAVVAVCVATAGSAAALIGVAAGAAVGGLVGAGSSAIGQYFANGEDWSKVDIGQVALDGLIGMASGAIAATGIGLGASIALGAGMGIASSVGQDWLNDSAIQWDKAIKSGIIGAISGAIAGAGAKGLTNKLAHSQKVLTGTIKNNTVKAITRQTMVRNKHLMQVAVSAARFAFSTSVTNFISRGGFNG